MEIAYQEISWWLSTATAYMCSVFTDQRFAARQRLLIITTLSSVNFPGRYGFVEFAQNARNANPKQIHFFDDNHSPYENGVFSFAKKNFALLRKNPREEMETAYFYAISTQKLDKTTITHIPRAYFNSVIWIHRLVF